MAGIEIAGHSDEWVALVEDRVIACGKSFDELVRKLPANIRKKAAITRVRGTFSTL